MPFHILNTSEDSIRPLRTALPSVTGPWNPWHLSELHVALRNLERTWIACRLVVHHLAKRLPRAQILTARLKVGRPRLICRRCTIPSRILMALWQVWTWTTIARGRHLATAQAGKHMAFDDPFGFFSFSPSRWIRSSFLPTLFSNFPYRSLSSV